MRQVLQLYLYNWVYCIFMMGWSAKSLSLFNSMSKPVFQHKYWNVIEPKTKNNEVLNKKSIIKSIISIGISAGFVFNIPEHAISSHYSFLNG